MAAKTHLEHQMGAAKRRGWVIGTDNRLYPPRDYTQSDQDRIDAAVAKRARQDRKRMRHGQG